MQVSKQVQRGKGLLLAQRIIWERHQTNLLLLSFCFKTLDRFIRNAKVSIAISIIVLGIYVFIQLGLFGALVLLNEPTHRHRICVHNNLYFRQVFIYRVSVWNIGNLLLHRQYDHVQVSIRYLLESIKIKNITICNIRTSCGKL